MAIKNAYVLAFKYTSGGIIASNPFIIGYFQGIRGTIYYHKNMKQEKKQDALKV